MTDQPSGNPGEFDPAAVEAVAKALYDDYPFSGEDGDTPWDRVDVVHRAALREYAALAIAALSALGWVDGHRHATVCDACETLTATYVATTRERDAALADAAAKARALDVINEELSPLILAFPWVLDVLDAASAALAANAPAAKEGGRVERIAAVDGASEWQRRYYEIERERDAALADAATMRAALVDIAYPYGGDFAGTPAHYTTTRARARTALAATAAPAAKDNP